MSDYITDEMVEAASEALHEESCPRSLRGAAEDCCDWTPWARAALAAAAALIAAKALRDAAEAFGENQTIREGDAKEWLNLRAERIERGEP